MIVIVDDHAPEPCFPGTGNSAGGVGPTMAHERIKANQVLVVLRAGPSEDPDEPSNHDFRRITASLCVPELPGTCQRLEQLFDEGFVITAMSPHPDNQILAPASRALLVAMKRG